MDDAVTQKVESAKPARPDPIGKANATGIGQKLAAMRGGGGGIGGMSRKEQAKLVRMKDGVSMSNQAPRTSSETIAPLEHMLRMVPTTRRMPPATLMVGDLAPDFEVMGSQGETMSLSSLKDRKPFALRLTRAMGSGVI
jgi:hypothetical protein